MKFNHPASWRILKANPKLGATRSSEYLLPTPKGEPDILITSFSANALLRHYDKENPQKPSKAGTFYRACKALIERVGDLSKLKNISLDADSTVRDWIAIYDEAVEAHGKGDMMGVSPVPEAEQTTPERSVSDIYKEIVLASIQGFATHVGPVADPKLIASQAKAVANAYGELQCQDEIGTKTKTETETRIGTK